MANRSKGSKLSAISSTLILITFFLPWVRACGDDLSGLDLATSSNGRVEDPWVYWLTLIAAAFCLVLHFLVKRTDVRARVGAAIARLVAGIVGALPLLNVLYNVMQDGANLKLLYGAYLTGLGYLGLGLSFFVDIFGLSSTSTRQPTVPVEQEYVRGEE